jgi:hypothetical protein
MESSKSQMLASRLHRREHLMNMNSKIHNHKLNALKYNYRPLKFNLKMIKAGLKDPFNLILRSFDNCLNNYCCLLDF